MLITLYVFLCICITPAVFSPCSDQQERKRRQDIISKLCSLGEMRPERCKGEAENMKVQSPKISKQEEIILPVLEMSFRILSDLLMKNPSSDWKSSDLHVLQQLLGHQRQFYATCYPVASSTHAEVEKWSAFWSNLTDYLTEKSFSSCAWESSRTVILQVMRGFYISTAKSSIKIC
ncbi:hypothetical protein HF521_011194 [Silurus meridionalis]|uniref:Uncharacterized protein n=1 Tax=Silurus meridionalis TaxID=175797 RepID=A0A8T0AJD1_SILME|nr:hypothetical protein HF521_011194 [Silurus meridionalis]